jgi:hypothetical protein
MKRGDKLDINFFNIYYINSIILPESVTYLGYNKIHYHGIEIKIEDRFFIRNLSDDDFNRYKTYRRTKIIEDLLK